MSEDSKSGELLFHNSSLKAVNKEEIRRILIEEGKKWDNFLMQGFPKEWQSIINYLSQIFKEVKDFAQRISYSADDDETLNNANKLLSSKKFPTHDIIVDRLNFLDNEDVAIYLFGLFGGGIEHFISNDVLKKRLNYFLYGVGDRDPSRNRASDLERFHREARKKLYYINAVFKSADDYIEKIGGMYKQLDAVSFKKHAEFVSYGSDLENSLSKKSNDILSLLDSKYSEVILKLDAAIPRAEEAAQEKIKLISLQKLWDDKFKIHKDKELKWLYGLIASIFFGLVIMFGGILMVIKFIPANEGRAIDLPIVAIGILMILVFWSIRLVTKIWLSHSHLKNDAHERSVMTQTYLSLMVGQKLSEEQKNMVFLSMFRPIKDGIVQDDGPNSPVIELLDKFKK